MAAVVAAGPTLPTPPPSDGSDVFHGGPSVDLVAIAAVNETTLNVVQSGPISRVDISQTIFKTYFPASFHYRLQSLARLWFGKLAVLYWLGQGIVLALPFLRENSPLQWSLTALSVLFAFPALLLSTGSLCTEMTEYVRREAEFRVVTILNTINWCITGIAFRDARALCCGIQWWSIQIAFLVDADFRLLGSHMRVAYVSLLVLLLYLGCALAGVLHHDGKATLVNVYSRIVSIVDILLWTAPTLAVFLIRNIYNQKRRSRGKRAQQATTVLVFCSLHKARLRVGPMSGFGSRRRIEVRKRPDAPLGIPLLRSHTMKTAYVSAVTVGRVPPAPLSHLQCSLFYLLGITSFSALIYASVDTQVEIEANTPSARLSSVPYAALAGSVVFIAMTARLYQLQLLMALFQSFDVLFSVSECLAGIILICDLHRWDYRCVNVITWVLWFLWVLCLDALTPPARHYLRFKKFAATPIQLFLLYAYLGVPLMLYVFVDPKLTSRLVYSVNSVEIRTDTLAVARMLTLALWQTRLLWDLGVRDDSEFIFLRDLVEYTVPRDVASSSDDGLRASSANAIVPRAVVQPKD